MSQVFEEVPNQHEFLEQRRANPEWAPQYAPPPLGSKRYTKVKTFKSKVDRYAKHLPSPTDPVGLLIRTIRDLLEGRHAFAPGVADLMKRNDPVDPLLGAFYALTNIQSAITSICRPTVDGSSVAFYEKTHSSLPAASVYAATAAYSIDLQRYHTAHDELRAIRISGDPSIDVRIAAVGAMARLVDVITAQLRPHLRQPTEDQQFLELLIQPDSPGRFCTWYSNVQLTDLTDVPAAPDVPDMADTPDP